MTDPTSRTMSAQDASVSQRVPGLTLGLSVIFTVLPLAFYLRGDGTIRTIIMAAAVVAIAAYVAVVHPASIFVAMAAVLGAVPYMHVPGTNVPLLLVLAVGLWAAMVFLPGVDARPGWPELWVLLLASTAVLSVVATDLSRGSLVEYAAWLAATAVVVPLRLLPVAVRVRTVRTFVVSTAFGAAVAMLIRADFGDALSGPLSVAGYDPERNVQYVYGSDSISTRLSGTFLEPNVAGLILAAGVVLAIAYFHGSVRIALVAVIGTGLLLTLSRAAMASLIVAGLVVVLRAPVRRFATIVVSLLGALAALVIPVVRLRLVESFGPSDMGTIARLDALREFPRLMEGHWIWGLGWDRAEFRSGTVGRAVNYVANAPLVTIYRGGLIVGIIAILVALGIVWHSWVKAGRSFEDAVVCGGVIGFVLVAMQLDFTIVLTAPATTVFSLLVAMSLTHAPESPPPRAAATHA
jgi:hypothetical protein